MEATGADIPSAQKRRYLGPILGGRAGGRSPVNTRDLSRYRWPGYQIAGEDLVLPS